MTKMSTMMIEDLKKRLHDGVVKFTYKKKDGTIREATGTTKLDSIPVASHPKGSFDAPDNVCRYYDLNSEGWRSFVIENLVSIDDNK